MEDKQAKTKAAPILQAEKALEIRNLQFEIQECTNRLLMIQNEAAGLAQRRQKALDAIEPVFKEAAKLGGDNFDLDPTTLKFVPKKPGPKKMPNVGPRQKKAPKAPAAEEAAKS